MVFVKMEHVNATLVGLVNNVEPRFVLMDAATMELANKMPLACVTLDGKALTVTQKLAPSVKPGIVWTECVCALMDLVEHHAQLDSVVRITAMETVCVQAVNVFVMLDFTAVIAL